MGWGGKVCVCVLVGGVGGWVGGTRVTVAHAGIACTAVQTCSPTTSQWLACLASRRAGNQQTAAPWHRPAAGQGSGFVWDSAGHIVTNFHVIRGASEVQARAAAC